MSSIDAFPVLAKALPSRPIITEDCCAFEFQKSLKLYSANEVGDPWLKQDELVWVRGSVIALWPKIVALASEKRREGVIVGLVTYGNHGSPDVIEGPEHATVRLFDRFYVCFGTIHVACHSAGEIAIFPTENHRYDTQPMRQSYAIEDKVDLCENGSPVIDECRLLVAAQLKL
ncbi:hypothetical protein NP233_g10126 [Leucocoprinus birnbaumii]|uniref:Uncharacterized protein n=1 Tax=Leucocoprinus birnbaumii TaxID=56174 RepID=A0AAD5YLL5_9AGAR|nr:hypothetical protein NP233_g10126 [Leucocoprinus birnbaumii]